VRPHPVPRVLLRESAGVRARFPFFDASDPVLVQEHDDVLRLLYALGLARAIFSSLYICFLFLYPPIPPSTSTSRTHMYSYVLTHTYIHRLFPHPASSCYLYF
jgi:hypothetical protein